VKFKIMYEIIIVLVEGKCDVGLFDALCDLDELGPSVIEISETLKSIERKLGCTMKRKLEQTTNLYQCVKRQQKNSGRIFIIREYAQVGLKSVREVLCELVRDLHDDPPQKVRIYTLVHSDCDLYISRDHLHSGSCTKIEKIEESLKECRGKKNIGFNLKPICDSSNNKFTIYILEPILKFGDLKSNNINAKMSPPYVVVPKPSTEGVLGIDPERGRTYVQCRDRAVEIRGELCGELCDRGLAELCHCSLAHGL